MIFIKNFSADKSYYELDLYKKPVTITIIPTSIVKGARKPIKPSGCCPTSAINKKLKANIRSPIIRIIKFCFESLS
ncbi:hypothetical protein KQ44_10125 [Brachyspira sp. G79]|nr:hypothetical protein KQ44_10125 [Brachyspira sp. G79]